MRLSKSRFVIGQQCHRRLWWTVHERDAPELRPDPALRAVFARGQRVGELARSYFPGGVLIELDVTRPGGPAEAMRATEKAIADGASVIYEACFEHDGVFSAVDILERGEGGWVLVEVKSGTKAKDVYVRDAALQTWVLRGVGLDVATTQVMHINRGCRFPDLSDLFTREDVSAQVAELLPSMEADIAAQRAMLQGTLPQVELGEQCTRPYVCPFTTRCWPRLPEHHVSELYRVRPERLARFAEQDIEIIPHIPSEELLLPVQERQRQAVAGDELVVAPGLAEVLEAFGAPVWFLDFETIMPAIPVWNGCAPYDQLPVQFSVHALDDDGRLTHREFLAGARDDPRESLALALIEATRGSGPVLAYYARFERERIRELAAAFPDLREALESLAARVEDLLPVIREYVYHPDFHGSFSLKKVLPALVPELAYDDLEIADGWTAAANLETLVLEPETMADADREQLRKDLLAYCERDTLGLVRLLERLQAMGASNTAAG